MHLLLRGARDEAHDALALMDSLSREAVERHRVIYPEPHPHLGRSFYYRSNALRRLERYDEAEAAVREYIQITEATRGTDNVDWINGHSQLARILFDRGAYDAAIAERRTVRDWWVRSYGADYLYTLRAELAQVEGVRLDGPAGRLAALALGIVVRVAGHVREPHPVRALVQEAQHLRAPRQVGGLALPADLVARAAFRRRSRFPRPGRGAATAPTGLPPPPAQEARQSELI